MAFAAWLSSRPSRRSSDRGSGLNKDALVAEVAKRTGTAKAEVAKIVDALTDTIKGTVARGQRVALVGFGTFEKRSRNARVGRNPRTGEAVKVPKTNVPLFRPGAAFKESVAGKRRTKVSTRKTSASRRAGRTSRTR